MLVQGIQRRRLQRLSSRMPLVSVLRVLWLIWLLWFEHGIFSYSLWDCSWPKVSSSTPVKPTNVLLISDPQVRYTPTNGRHRWSDDIRRLLYHITLRKNWNYAFSMKPDAVVFLGDMLASGSRVTRDDEYDQYFRMFSYLLPVPNSIPVYYTPGNEDLGLRTDLRTSHTARYHFDQHFSSVNSRVSMANHTFIILDSPGLVEEDYIRDEHRTEYEHWVPLEGGAIEFVKSLASGEDHLPTILFSHIPLARPDTASCGPLRETGSIRRGVGIGYQNTLGKKTTNFLFRNIKPCIIFSGDDRDYCDYDHQISTYLNFREPDHPSVREITVKSISPVKYIRNPGFHLLTLTSPPSTSSTSTPKTFADAPCHLPAHFSNYRSKYFPFTLLTLIILVLSRYRTRRRGRLPTSIRKSSLPTYYQTHHANSTTEEITSESEAWHILEPEDLTEFQDNPYDSYSLALGARISPREPLPTTLRTPSLKPPTGLKTSTSSDGGFYSVGLNSITPTTPTFRASIHSAAPIQSGFMSSPPGERDEYGNEEDDDPMCPSYTQATSSRSHSRRSSYSLGFQPSASSSSRNISGVLSPSASVFFPPATSDSSKNFSTSQAQLSIQQHQQLPQTTLPPPPTQAQRKARNAGWYTFSRSFVFRSRRRRMTILFPVFWSSHFWTSIFSPHHPQRGPSTSNPYSGYPPKLPPTGIVRGSLVDFWRVIWPVVLSWCLLTWWSMS